MSNSLVDNIGDRIVAALLIVFAGFIFIYTASFPEPAQSLDPGIDAFPRIIASLIGLLALMLLLKPREWERFPRGSGMLRVLGTVGLVFLYYLAIVPLGFVITTSLFLVLHLLLIGVRKPIPIFVVTLIGGLGVFYLFRNVLDVPLPLSGVGGLPF